MFLAVSCWWSWGHAYRRAADEIEWSSNRAGRVMLRHVRSRAPCLRVRRCAGGWGGASPRVEPRLRDR
jgi:hypothetical protein